MKVYVVLKVSWLGTAKVHAVFSDKTKAYNLADNLNILSKGVFTYAVSDSIEVTA